MKTGTPAHFRHISYINELFGIQSNLVNSSSGLEGLFRIFSSSNYTEVDI